MTRARMRMPRPHRRATVEGPCRSSTDDWRAPALQAACGDGTEGRGARSPCRARMEGAPGSIQARRLTPPLAVVWHRCPQPRGTGRGLRQGLPAPSISCYVGLRLHGRRYRDTGRQAWQRQAQAVSGPGRRVADERARFPGRGLAEAARELARVRGRTDGIPIAASMSGTSIHEVTACHRMLEPLVEAVEVNISSPNTAGLRVFHEPAALPELLGRLNEGRGKPLAVKLPPYPRRMARRPRLSCRLPACVAPPGSMD